MRTVLLRTNALVLIAVGLLAIPASFAVRDLSTGLVALACYAAAAIAFVPSWPRIVPRVFAVGLASVSIVYSTWLLGGRELDTALTAGIRILVLALPGAVVSAFVDPAGLADQLGQRLRLPARPVVAFAAALQRFEHLGESWQQLDRARRARGRGPGRNPIARFRHAAGLTFGLLVVSMRGATSMSIAMDARGFATARSRTWAEPAPWTGTDSVVLAVGVLLAAVPVVLYLS